MKPHPHAKLIKAWADGATIELQGYGQQTWTEHKDPPWNSDFYRFRIKPESQKRWLYIYNNMVDGKTWVDEHPNEMLYPEWKYMGKIEVLK